MYKQTTSSAAIQSQDKLCRVLLEQLEESTLSDINITQLCRQAGVGRSSFYRNFDKPEDILRYLLDRLCTELTWELSALPKESTGRQAYFFTLMQYWYEQPRLLQILFRDNCAALLMERLGEAIEFSLPQQGRRTLPPQSYLVLAGGILSLLKLSLDGQLSLSPQSLATALADWVN